jgi:hypothetical protein
MRRTKPQFLFNLFALLGELQRTLWNGMWDVGGNAVLFTFFFFTWDAMVLGLTMMILGFDGRCGWDS